MPDGDFCLSVVATSRNDNHGKDLLYRMQCFVDGFIEQCKRHSLKAELILVEWNPPEGTLPLSQALQFPVDKGPCVVRIIRVPNEIHMKLDHAEKIPLFQMIGKNVGIRRALGKFVLATNIDVLFSDKLMKFIKKKLQTGKLYRVDRLDVPERLPPTESFDEVLDFCSENYFRVNHRLGTNISDKRDRSNRFILFYKPLLKAASFLFRKLLNISIISLIRSVCTYCWKLLNTSIASLSADVIYFFEKVKKAIRKLICFIYPNNSIFLHTNACGDFTLLSYDDWMKLRGYPEWNIFSWHIDSILLYQARQHGIQEIDLPKALPIYHIEHETGSGYSPEGANQLFKRLNAKGIPYLSNMDLKTLVDKMKESEEKIVYNNEEWGMANVFFEEFVL